jgi:hypothetical protein
MTQTSIETKDFLVRGVSRGGKLIVLPIFQNSLVMPPPRFRAWDEITLPYLVGNI